MSKSRPISLRSLAILSCFGTVLCWSSGPIFIKYLTGHIDAWTQNLLRYAVGCLFWLPFLLADLKAGRVPKAVWKRALLPLAPNLVMQTLWAAAFYYIDPGFATLLVKTSIIWIVILSMIFFPDERGLMRSWYFRLSIILSAVGVTGVTFYKHDFALSYTIMGIVIILSSAFVWAIYTITVKVAMRDINSRIGFSVISIYTVAGLFILAIFNGEPSKCLEMPVAAWVSTVISGITAIALGHVLYYVAIRGLGVTIPSLVLLSQPFVVVIISHLLYSESLNLTQGIFGIVLLAGSALAILAKKDLA